MKLQFYVSEFVKICKSYINKKFDFDESSENKIEYLRKCLKALFSLSHVINNHASVDEKLRFRDINSYFEFVDRNIRYAVAYVNVVGKSFSFHDLAKTLFKSKICS